MKHYDVLIATPGAMMEAQYVKSLVATLAECDKRGITYKFLNNYSSLVHHAREATITGGDGANLNPDDTAPLGGTVTYNKIFWIDSDISWEPWQFFRIYDSEYDVCTGAYLLADGTTTSVHEWGIIGGMPKQKIMQMSETMKVQSMGFGFVAMKSGVFERIERPWFKHQSQPIKRSDGTEIVDSIGEDVSWCIGAYNAGIDIYFDPDVLVKHMKKIPISW
jgi:hypothetical protein